MRHRATAATTSHYVHRLDLGADPFVEGFRSDYFYEGGQRRQILDQVLHYSRFSDQVVLLVGSTGSGTSTIFNQLLDQLEPLMDFCSVDAESVATPVQLLETLSSQLQFSNIDSVTAFAAALRYNAEMVSAEEPLLVAVDQAHYLGIESLEVLRQLLEQSAGLLHLLLAGEYQIEQLAKLAGFDSDRMKLHELESLGAEETGEYLLGLLQSVGYAGEQPLSDDQLAILHEQSGGNITEINLLAPKLLNIETKAADAGLNFAIPWSHVAAIAVLLIAIGFSYWYQSDAVDGDVMPVAVESPLPESEAQRRNELEVALPLAGQSAELQQAATPAEDANADDGGNRVPQPVVAERTRPVDQAIDAEEALTIKPAGEQSMLFDDAPAPGMGSSAQGPHVQGPNKQGTVQRDTVAPASGQEKPLVPTTTKTKSNDIAARPSTAAQSAIGKDKTAVASPDQQPGTEPATDKKAIDTRPQSSSTQSPASSDAVSQSMRAGERRLLQMNDQTFVLQLMGSIEEDRARRFVNAYTDAIPIFYFETRRDGKPWFVAVTGPYANKDAARAGIARLPEKLQRQQPWVRSMMDIKKEIRQSR